MTDINNLFFELIKIAIGNASCLSRTPSAQEWKELYDIAKKQSLVGVCFAGVQKLVDQQQAPEQMLYLTWMGMAAKIQQRNEVVNQQCVELQKRLSSDGFDAVVLKGQSVARKYGTLASLRQSGDIDAWLTGDRNQIKDYITKNYPIGEVIYNHAHVHIFDDTEVEVHFTPSWLYSPFRNEKLQEWFQGYQESFRFKFQEEDGFKSPSVEFDLVYLILHNYRHLMHEGLGLRQVMDYYFALRSVPDGLTSNSFSTSKHQEVLSTMQLLGLLRFAEAMMYVLQIVFGLDEQDMICKPDKKRGERLLTEIMRGGNMGRGDDRTRKASSRMGYFWEHVSRQWSFMRDYPSEVLWSPLWKTWHFIMRKTGRI